MIIKKPEFLKLTNGGYSVIFCDAEYNYAYKLFISFDHSSKNFQDWGKRNIVNNYLKEVFETERKAYEIIQSSELLKRHTPNFSGSVIIDSVIDNEGNDISNQFLLDCCLKMEFIKGMNTKLEYFKRNPNFSDKVKRIMTEFKNHKINYLIDAQVIVNGQNFVILDFQTENSMDMWERKYL